MPKSSRAADVCSPTAATLTPANARASRPYSSNRSRTARTAFTEVNATHWYRPVTRPLTARSICWGVRGGSTAIVGTSSGTAPYSRSRCDTTAACSLVRGTRIRQPNSGLVSNHDSSSRAATASPTTAMAGPLVLARDTPAALRSGPMRPRVETTVCCALVVPSQVMANGVVSGQPAATSILPISAGAASAPSTTRVAGLYATRLTSAAWMTRSSPFGSLASGMPAYVGTAVTSGTPGTISNLTPALAHAVASAAARPSSGSPPYSRTASWPSSAARTRTPAAAPSAGSSRRAPGLM